jgi:hypothetical protein
VPASRSRRSIPLRPASRRASAALIALLTSSSVGAATLPESGELACLRAATGECNYRDPISGLTLRWPNDWPVRRLKLVTETGPVARSRQRDAIRWVSVEYLPDDQNLPEAPLFRLAVLRRGDWHAQLARPVPPSAVEVASGRGLVAVFMETPNSYPPGSRDADIFAALQPGPVEISLIVGIPEE